MPRAHGAFACVYSPAVHIAITASCAVQGRRRYGVLLQAGVEIFEYSSRMMHAKVLVVDGRWALLGSTNIDHRSFGLNDEVNLLVSSDALAMQLRATFEQDLGQSSLLDLRAWRRRSWSERILATLGRIIERHQ